MALESRDSAIPCRTRWPDRSQVGGNDHRYVNIKKHRLQIKNKSQGKNTLTFNARNALCQCTGVDLTRTGEIDLSTALKVLVEISPDLSKLKNAKRFEVGYQKWIRTHVIQPMFFRRTVNTK